MGENIATRVAYGRALEEFGGREDIYVFDSDLKSCTMTQYFAEKYPDRFFNMGIAEANMPDLPPAEPQRWYIPLPFLPRAVSMTRSAMMSAIPASTSRL